MRKLFLFFLVFSSVLTQAQELNCTVSINAEQTGQDNLQVFKTLERDILEFMNETKWTNLNVKNQERIDCSLVIIVRRIDSDFFEATLQVQSSRPIYNSTYDSPVFNFNDRDFNFQYTEFQPLNFNPNIYTSNLISVLAFYAYTIIGIDADTFQEDGGRAYFELAKQIVNTAQQSGTTGWQASGNTQTRFRLNQDLLSPNFGEFHEVMYNYHRLGMDTMAQNQKQAKQDLADTLELMRRMYNKRPNNFLTRVFFDAKAEEISQVFSDGPQVNIKDLVETLNRVAPTKANYWRSISF
ncbi:type IX secretion system protein PorD [Croceiramulus getboli]|nr:DUF4835 family protein [Flavobacteriaceae bacterium YJPT1-3]